MKRLLLASAVIICSTIVTNAQLFRFHHVLPKTLPPAANTPVTPQVEGVEIKNKLNAQAVAQNYPVTTETAVNFLYREIGSKEEPKPIYTGRQGIWAVVKMNGVVPVVDVWQIKNLTPVESRPDVINEATDLDKHQIEIDLSRKNVGAPTRVIKIPFRAFLVSYNTVPLRFRWNARGSTNPTPATSDLSFAVNVGGVRGNSFFSPRGVNHYGYALSFFVGATTVSLGKTTYYNQSSYEYDRTNLGLSTGLAFTLIRNNIGLVVALGVDHSTGVDSEEWIYQRKPWVGFGISTGLGFF
ncbi:hypothetical protein [Hymenobacter elongatus]|uniref:Outer membrane protein beta-barrel domain-containing protein n=1 Tax=Hymenobacter elongatus TaxID=877208 RepID=A0A4Z0PIJ9_9BACT|nr:hypothetical protein [Hymenobacter elongatus]TGE14971.1 hypothetical protein E5J99_13765 [Hymenobacter elongatus]